MTSPLKAQGLFSVFWPFSIIMSFGWFPFVFQLPSPQDSLMFATIVAFMFHRFWSFFQFPSKVEVRIRLYTFFKFNYFVSKDSKIDSFANPIFFFLLIIIGLVFWPRLGDMSVCQSPKGVHVCPFL